MARHKQETREQTINETRHLLLDAAVQEIAREGYEGANINHISEAAGFAKGTIYNYFPSKRALMLALIDEIAARHLELVAARVNQEADPARRMERFFEAGFAFVVDHPEQAQIMFSTLNGHDVAFKQAMGRAYQPMFRLVGTDIIEVGVSQGIFRPVDPVAMSGLLMTLYLGAASQTDENGRPWMQPEQVADFVLHALDSK
jgi:AcrR family transcriptional regulator